MKLEPKHIAPYLPYELQVIHEIETTFTLLMLRTDTMTAMLKVNREMPNGAYWQVPIEDIKLILRPMSDIYKPCLDGGKIPIVELAKMSIFYDSVSEPQTRIGINNDCVILDYGITGTLFILWDNINKQLRCGNSMFVSFEIFQKLFEWHFNVFNLPEELFIDINTIEK